MRIPRRYWRNLDWPLVLAVLTLTIIGMVVISLVLQQSG